MALTRLALAGAALALAGCEAMTQPEPASRSAVLALGAGASSEASAALDLRVTSLAVAVPDTLTVSDGGGYYPFADIVWRGDPAGDRRDQVAALFEAAGARATAADEGAREATARVVLERFHGVTERSRYTVGGLYSIRFTLTYLDAATGAPLTAPEVIEANLNAPGGTAAVELERQGQTERVRVVDHLAYVLSQEFAGPVPAL